MEHKKRGSFEEMLDDGVQTGGDEFDGGKLSPVCELKHFDENVISDLQRLPFSAAS